MLKTIYRRTISIIIKPCDNKKSYDLYYIDVKSYR